MKKYLYTIALLVAIASANFSCSKFLDYRPDDRLTMEMIWNDRIRTEDWLSGVYSGIPNPMWGYFKDQGFSIMGDDMTIPAAWQQFGWSSPYAYTMGNWSAISYWGPYYWVELPKRIRQGLIFLENVKPLADKDMEQGYVDLMKGEVRFLMAYYYWLMVEIYGPIPFTPSVIYPTDASLEAMNIPQTPVDSIVDYLDKEFLNVAEILPPIWNTDYVNLKLKQDDFSAWGRATSIMALAMRARMLMHYASPLLNGNPDYVNVVRKDGVHLFPTSYDANKWKRAADACKLLIDKAHAAGYKLYYEYNEDGSIDPFMSYYNVFQKKWNEGNKEIIFGRPGELGNLDDWQNHHLPIGIGGNGGMGVTQELVDAFFMKNGLPITDPGSGYTEKGFSTEPEIRKTKWRGAEGPERKVGQVTQVGTFNMYCNREPRFYASVIYNEAWLGVANRRANFFLGGADGGPSFDAPQNGYNVRKRISLEANPRGAHPYQPGILHRLAEFYLDYAEALNEFDPSNPDILVYINKIRERAGIPGLTGGLSQSEMREAIIRERRVEFNCEGLRIHDLRRWKLAEKYLGNKMYGMNFLGTKKSDDSSDPLAYYKRTFSVQRNFYKRQYLWPVPQAQMDINPNLVQMPGY